MPKKKRSTTGERRKYHSYQTKKKCQEKSKDILLDYAAIENGGHDDDGYTDSAIAPLSLDEDVVPLGLDEDVTPLSLDEDVAPLSLDEDVAPLSLDEDVAPLSLDEDVAPLSLGEDVAQVCLDNGTYTHLSLDHSYASYSNVDDLKINQDHSDSEVIELPYHINMDTYITYNTLDESEEPLNLFDTLTREIKKELSTPYVCISAEDSIDILEFYKVNGKISVKISVSINRKFQARILVHQKEVLASHDFWTGLPSRYDSYSKFSSLMSKLKKYVVCIGNPDKEFETLVPVGSGLSGSGSSEIIAYREGDFCAQLGDLTYNSTIRLVDCGLLVEGTRCSKCSTYRRYLWERKHRMEAKSKHMQKNLLSSTYKHKDMTREMLIEKIRQQKTCLNSLQHEVDRNRRIIKQQIVQSETDVI
ncbi:uncharacterized protein LOC117321642 [Pecten maximus]|uniref:uncharacterized protein LOC117321642 n=1 Tax=Pecten maximus TaxID=6579 RepID=UPI001458271D|nr:uncharacterized protein LOC117321642 [Pecten maximus]